MTTDTEIVEEQTPTIVQALAAVMGDVRAVAKADRNKSQGFNFRGIDSVTNAVAPALRKHGVIVIPVLENLERFAVTTTRGAAMNGVLVKVRYEFHGPAGDHLQVVVPGEAYDSADKATAKAMSVAFRTALLQALTLPTDEVDPDAEFPEGMAATGGTDPAAQAAERAFAEAWNNPDALRRLHSWYAGQGAPAQFLDRIQSRLTQFPTTNA